MNGVSPLTDERWERLIAYYRTCGRLHIVQGLLAAKEFHTSMEKLQSMGGHSQEQFSEISQAIRDMAQQGGQGQQ